MKTDNNDLRKNGSGYNDPTAYAVISKIVCSNIEPKKRNRAKDIADAMQIIKKLLEIIDFEIDGKVTLVDKQTGKKYK